MVSMSIENIPTIAMSIILGFLTLVVVAIIFSSVASDQLDTQLNNLTNETFTLTLQAGDGLSGYNGTAQLVHTRIVPASEEVRNTTTLLVLGADYRLNNLTGVITVVTNYTVGDADINISYNYETDIKNAAFNVTDQGNSMILNLSDNLPTVGLVIGAVLIIAVLLGGFAFKAFGVEFK
jgi:hypothetical protein